MNINKKLILAVVWLQEVAMEGKENIKKIEKKILG